ncbi:hypothetical protein V5O48_008849, partial [Marasmius crinis-equi]
IRGAGDAQEEPSGPVYCMFPTDKDTWGLKNGWWIFGSVTQRKLRLLRIPTLSSFSTFPTRSFLGLVALVCSSTPAYTITSYPPDEVFLGVSYLGLRDLLLPTHITKRARTSAFDSALPYRELEGFLYPPMTFLRVQEKADFGMA